MSDPRAELQRFAALSDRAALGEELTAEELAFCREVEARLPEARREAALYRELEDLDAPVDGDTRAVVDGALARLYQAQTQASDSGGRHATRRGARSRRVLAGAGTLAVAAAAGLFLLASREDSGTRPSDPSLAGVGSANAARPESSPESAPRIELVYVSGSVELDGKPVHVSSTLLAPGSELAIQNGSACLAMDPGIDVCLGEHSKLRLTAITPPQRRLDLLSGQVAAKLVPQPAGSNFSIVAGEVWSTAVGTAFSVEAGAEHGITTTVLSGKVSVRKGDGDRHLLAAHQRATVRGEAVDVGVVGRSDEAPAWALLQPVALWSNRLSSSLDLTDFPAGADLRLDGQRLGTAPLSSLIPAGMHRLEVRLAGELQMRRDFVAQAGQTVKLRYEPATLVDAASLDAHDVLAVRAAPGRTGGRSATRPASASEVGGGAEPVAGAGTLLSEARRLLRAGDLPGAAERYGELRQQHPMSPEAQPVLVSLAQIELTLGRPRASLANAERYLVSGHGELAQEARSTQIRALRALGEVARERTAIEQFLRLHPRSFEAEHLARRLAELSP